jgi:putative transposase
MIQQSQLPITKASSALGVTPRGYYGWKKREQPTDPDEKLRAQLHEIALEFPKYGYRKMMHTIRRTEKIVNHKRILRLMKEENLLVRRKKTKPKTTQSNHKLQRYPNLAKDLVPTTINQAWVSDITYINLGRGFVYLAAIIDLFSRRCVGWALSRNPNTQLTLDALNRAVMLRGNVQGCIHHSDHGVQYAAGMYVQRLNELGILPSMGEVGNSYDNAYAESFFKTLKNEEVWMNEYETMQDVYCNIKRFIEEVYNKKRLHSSVGYKPPIEFEQQQILNTRSEA